MTATPSPAGKTGEGSGNNKQEITPVEKVATEQNQSTEKEPTKEEITTTIETKVIETKTIETPAIETNAGDNQIIKTPAIETNAEDNQIIKTPNPPKVAYTKEEKFAEMIRKNPALMTLKQQLSLEFI